MYMAIIQDTFFIPDNIMTKINTGDLRRVGGVIRYAKGPKKGRIFKLLNPVQIDAAEKAEGIVANAIKLAKNNKKALIITGIGTGVVGGLIYYKSKIYESEVVTQFRLSLKNYINGIRNSDLSSELISDLMINLENLKNHKDYEKIKFQLSTEELDVLVNRIHEYTEKLAKDNSIELTEEELDDHTTDGAIVNLQRYLRTQKRIFETAV